ncbi:hypothetical protein [Nocardia sp.]|uniref:hypothetical protein n=1 Tax=Nocardia sp. TaxID=1821 RepID=UPI0025905B97|nr:hypothetical protein [Nocardia sp.]
MFDTTALRAAYDALLDAAVTVADTATAPPPGEWNADQILAHVTLVDATTIGVVAAVTAGSHTVYDTRLTLDPWTIDRAITLAGGSAGLRARISGQADAMCALVGSSLSETELDIPVSTRLLSGTTLLLRDCHCIVRARLSDRRGHPYALYPMGITVRGALRRLSG